jgi:branched-chain amino acid transport system permease protein
VPYCLTLLGARLGVLKCGALGLEIVEQAWQIVVSGVMIGAIYGLASIGLTLIFGVLRLINFAHGHFLMVALYLAFWLNSAFRIDPYAGALIVMAALFMFGWVVQYVLIKPTLGKPSASIAQTFVTLGLAMALQNGALALFSADYLSVRTPYSNSSVTIFGASISVPRLVIFVVTIGVAVGLHLWLKHTYFGKAIRATVDNARAAQLMGVDINRVFLVTFGIGSALVGLAGALLLPVYYVFPRLGLDFVLITFVVAVLGGLGSIWGAVTAGFLIGVIETASGFLIGTAWKQAIYFGLFILVLVVRPAGLFGVRGAEEVGLK